jgi:hypothetical protein
MIQDDAIKDTEQYKAGFEAGMIGLSHRSNLFGLGVDGRQKWNAGYHDGRDEFISRRTQTEVQAVLNRDRAALGLPN